MVSRRLRVALPLAVGTALALLLLSLLGPKPTEVTAGSEHRGPQAPQGVITVCLSGGCDFTSIQAAVDAADEGDAIKVAAGTYTGVNVRPRNDYVSTGVVTQVVYISKTVTIRGGYTTTNAFAEPPDLAANATRLDAQGQGRVIYVSGDIVATLEGLHITGGDVSSENGLGGGLFVFSATATISNSQLVGNTAFGGGGACLFSSAATLNGNTIVRNTATHGGGGLAVTLSAATIRSNEITSNTATWGGGLNLYHSDVTATGNTVVSNTAGLYGGGLYLVGGANLVRGNTIMSNTADSGGGLQLYQSYAELKDNTVKLNFASGWGGGAVQMVESDAALIENTIVSNAASNQGGGLDLYQSQVELNGDTVVSNTAGAFGGGLYLEKSGATLVNTVVADNIAGEHGSGIQVLRSSLHLLHNTIARNRSGDGSALFVTQAYATYSTVLLTNTVLVSHTVGISVTGGNTVSADAILWHDTPITVSQSPTAVVTVQNQRIGDPVFASDGYHIGPGSAALDAGVNAGVGIDVDRQPRPYQTADLGADEYWPPGALRQVHLPLVLRSHQ